VRSRPKGLRESTAPEEQNQTGKKEIKRPKNCEGPWVKPRGKTEPGHVKSLGREKLQGLGPKARAKAGDSQKALREALRRPFGNASNSEVPKKARFVGT